LLLKILCLKIGKNCFVLLETSNAVSRPFTHDATIKGSEPGGMTSISEQGSTTLTSEQCGTTLMSELSGTMSMIATNTRSEFSCDDCDKTSTSKQNLLRDRQVKHGVRVQVPPSPRILPEMI